MLVLPIGEDGFFEPGLPAGPAGSAGIERALGAAGGGQVPAQLGGAGLAPEAVAQQEDGGAARGGPEAEAAAGGEIERFGLAGHFGDDGGDGAAGEGFLGGPEQFDHVGGPDQNQGLGIEAEAVKTGPIGQAQFLGLGGQLQVDNAGAGSVAEGAGLGQGEAKGKAGIAPFVGEHLLHQAGWGGERIGRRRAVSGRGQNGAPLDIGDAGAQGIQLLAMSEISHGRGPRVLEQIVNTGLGCRVKTRLEGAWCGAGASTGDKSA